MRQVLGNIMRGELLRRGVKFGAEAIGGTIGFIYDKGKYILVDLIGKKMIRAPISWAGMKLGQGAAFLGRGAAKVVTTGAGEIKNLFSTGTAKTSSLAKKTAQETVGILTGITRVPGKMRKFVTQNTAEALDLVFNLPDHLSKTPLASEVKEGRDVFFNLPDHLKKLK